MAPQGVYLSDGVFPIIIKMHIRSEPINLATSVKVLLIEAKDRYQAEVLHDKSGCSTAKTVSSTLIARPSQSRPAHRI